MCSVFIIYMREDSRNAAAINFFVNIRSRRGGYGAQTKNALPTGAGRAGKAGDTDSRHSFTAMPGTVEGI